MSDLVISEGQGRKSEIENLKELLKFRWGSGALVPNVGNYFG